MRINRSNQIQWTPQIRKWRVNTRTGDVVYVTVVYNYITEHTWHPYSVCILGLRTLVDLCILLVFTDPINFVDDVVHTCVFRSCASSITILLIKNKTKEWSRYLWFWFCGSGSDFLQVKVFLTLVVVNKKISEIDIIFRLIKIL